MVRVNFFEIPSVRFNAVATLLGAQAKVATFLLVPTEYTKSTVVITPLRKTSQCLNIMG